MGSAVAGLQLRRILDLLQANGLPPSEFDLRQQGHLPHHEDQGPLAALGRRLVKVVPDIGEPLGRHQGLQVRLDPVLIERLADPAQELGLDLVGGDRGVSLELDLGDRSFGEPLSLRRAGTGSTRKAKIAVAHARPIALSAEPSPAARDFAGGRALHGTSAMDARSGAPTTAAVDSPASILDPARRNHPWCRWGRAFVRSHERSFLNRTDEGRPDDI